MAAELQTKKRKLDPAVAYKQNLVDLVQSARRPDFVISDEFLLLLSKSRPADVSPGKQEIHSCTRTDTVSSVLQKLQTHHLSSLPVLTAANTYYGFIDMVDVMRFIVDLIGEEQMEKSDWEFDNLPIYQQTTVKEVMRYPIARRNPFQTVAETDSLLTVCEAFAKGFHRVAVLNEERELVQVISQSAMLRWIDLNKHTLGDKAKMPVKYFDSANQYVVSALHDEKAIDAFKVLKVCNVTGIALINDDGTLMGSLSASDMKKIHSTAKFSARLFQPVGSFIQIYSRKKKEPLSVNGQHTLEQVLKKLVKNQVHRLFVINEKNEPVGLISMTDVFQILLAPV